MDAQPETPAAAGADEVGFADAYEVFWDCVENDTPAVGDLDGADVSPADAYCQFWEMTDA